MCPCSVFLGVSERQEARGQIRRLKETKKYEEDIAHYRDWMQRAGRRGGEGEGRGEEGEEGEGRRGWRRGEGGGGKIKRVLTMGPYGLNFALVLYKRLRILIGQAQSVL